MLARIFAVTVGLLVATAPLAAQTGDQLQQVTDETTTRVGTRGANFLELGIGARAMAMSGAYTALAEGVSSMYWNSAGLASVRGLSVGYSYSPLYPDLDMSLHFVGVALPLFGGIVGLSADVFDSGDILRTTTDHPDGGDPLFGPTFDWTAQAFGLHYAFYMTDRLQFGFAGRVVTEGITDATATYYGFDVGVKFRTGLLGTVIGASMANLGTDAQISGRATGRRETETISGGTRVEDLNRETDDNSLPTVFRFSIMWDVAGRPESLMQGDSRHHVVVMTDVSDAIDTSAQPIIGIEYSYNDMFFARGGKKWMNEDRSPWDFSDGLSVGAGLKIPILEQAFRFDYAYTSMGDLDNLQIFTLQYGF